MHANPNRRIRVQFRGFRDFLPACRWSVKGTTGRMTMAGRNSTYSADLRTRVPAAVGVKIRQTESTRMPG